MSISIKDISKFYDDQAALKSISLEVKKGEIVGFLGPNGAGKSTLMKILSCYHQANEGEAFVCGYNVKSDTMEVRKRLGYLPEHNPLYMDMYVKEYLTFIADIYSTHHDRIDEMIKMTGLSPEKHKKIEQLSKGYRQRVGLAAALIHDPEVLILDEPTTGLDPNQLSEIRSLIKEVGTNKTVILSTHIMQEVDKMCSRVVVINKGNIIDDQNIDALRKKDIDLENYFSDLTQ